MNASWIKAAAVIQKKATQLAIDPTLTRLLTYSIIHWRTTNPPAVPDFVTTPYIPLFQQQTALGWDQILKGRFTKQWAQQQNRFAQTTNGHAKIAILTFNIMTQVYNIWKIRCDVQHGTTQEDIKNKVLFQLSPHIHALYAAKAKLAVIDQRHLDIPLEQILALPLAQLEHWIERTTKLIKTGLRRAAIQQRLHTPSIQTFFHPQTQTKSKRPANHNHLHRAAIPSSLHRHTSRRHCDHIDQPNISVHDIFSPISPQQHIQEKSPIHPSCHPNKCKPP
jgi:hypothetical protein